MAKMSLNSPLGDNKYTNKTYSYIEQNRVSEHNVQPNIACNTMKKKPELDY